MDGCPVSKPSFFSRSASLLGYKTDEAKLPDPCLSSRHFTSRFTSNGSFVDSECDFKCSQESQISLTDLEAMVSCDNEQALPSINVEGLLTPRAATPLPSFELQSGVVEPSTPDQMNESLDPVTPMANLKLLMSAVSPELRDRECLKDISNVRRKRKQEDLPPDAPVEKQCRYVTVDSRTETPDIRTIDEAQMVEEVTSVDENYSRKDRSLGLLCSRFLDLFPEHVPDNTQTLLSLDSVAQLLGVGRRRIYDIINVLESLSMIGRVAKNQYSWFGRDPLLPLLKDLLRIAETDGVRDSLQKYVEIELKKQNTSKVKGTKNQAVSKESDRKDNSLGYLCQKLLMLFLSSPSKVVSLDLAAKIFLADIDADENQPSKLKTKVRRLYDVANILSTLRLIRKVQTSHVGKKPAFQYIGPDPSLPSPKNSLVTQKEIDSATATLVAKEETPFRRHSSFEVICDVAEKERNRLYFESTKMKKRSVPAARPTAPVPAPVASAITLSEDQINKVITVLEKSDDSEDIVQQLQQAKKGPSQLKPVKRPSPTVRVLHLESPFTEPVGYKNPVLGQAAPIHSPSFLVSPMNSMAQPLFELSPGLTYADESLFAGLISPHPLPRQQTPVTVPYKPDMKVIKEGISCTKVTNAVTKVYNGEEPNVIVIKPLNQRPAIKPSAGNIINLGQVFGSPHSESSLSDAAQHTGVQQLAHDNIVIRRLPDSYTPAVRNGNGASKQLTPVYNITPSSFFQNTPSLSPPQQKEPKLTDSGIARRLNLRLIKEDV